MDDYLWFGKKYWGWPLRCIPCSYFRWMREKVPHEDLDQSLQDAVLREWERRKCGCPNSIPPEPFTPEPEPEYEPPPKPRAEPDALPKPVVVERVRSWYRHLAAQFHPDKKNGNTDAMIAINVAHEKIKEILEIE